MITAKNPITDFFILRFIEDEAEREAERNEQIKRGCEKQTTHFDPKEIAKCLDRLR